MGDNINKTMQIADTIHGSVKLNSIEKQVISTPIFNRLHGISQNSTAYLTFPTNRTKRFEHSIGTMQLCGEIFRISITNSDEETLDKFFKKVENIIDKRINNSLDEYLVYRNIIGDRNFEKEKIIKYKESIINREYNGFIPNNVKEDYKYIYTVLFQAIRLSALMHDVGHPPLSHITEFALKDLWIEIKNVDEKKWNYRQKEYISIMKNYFETKQDLHEQIGNKITSKVMNSLIDNITDTQAKNKMVFQCQLFKVIVSEVTLAILEEKDPIFSDIHRIIDGTLDGDRLDYVSRDPLNSGINVGCIEYDRLLESMRLINEEENFLFIPSTKCIDSIEDFFNRRWKMYKQIIYHHRVIKTDYLLQDCIIELGRAYLNNEELKDETKSENSRILEYDISSIWKAIEDKQSHKYFFDRLIQWDDGWLMAILKKHYFDEYMDLDDNITSNKLEELLSNKKFYYSLIKRTEDFIVIDKAVAKSVFDHYSEIIELISKIQEKTKYSQGTNGTIIVNLDILFKYALELQDTLQRYIIMDEGIPSDGFILKKISKIYSNILPDNWFFELVLECVNQIKKNPVYNIKDAFAVTKKIKIGIQGGKNAKQGGLGIYRAYDEKIEVKSFLNLSNVGNIITMETNLMPMFYLYVFKNNENELLDYNKIKTDLGISIGEKIVSVINDELVKLIK